MNSKPYVVLDQIKMCDCLYDSLQSTVKHYAEAGCPDWAGYKTPRFSGQCKTQICNDIKRLRRELLILEKVVSE